MPWLNLHGARKTALLAAAVLTIAGCGGGGTAYDAGYLERELPRAFRTHGRGELRKVECVKGSENEYRCYGVFRPSLASMRSELGEAGVNMSAHQLQRIRTGPLTLRVTVDPDSGKFIAE